MTCTTVYDHESSYARGIEYNKTFSVFIYHRNERHEQKGSVSENSAVINILLAEDPASFLFKEQHLSV